MSGALKTLLGRPMKNKQVTFKKDNGIQKEFLTLDQRKAYSAETNCIRIYTSVATASTFQVTLSAQ